MNYIDRLILLIVAMSAVIACNTQEYDSNDSLRINTYHMKFECVIDVADYVPTKSSYQWNDGAVVQIQFHNKNYRIAGTATYSAATDDWTVATASNLKQVENSNCEVYWFNGLESSSSDPLLLGPKVAPFNDIAATYSLSEDNYMVVNARLFPMTSRIRFVGKPDTAYGVKGLRYCSSYSVSSNSFAREAETIDVRIGEDGSSPYYYVLFEDTNKRELVVSGEYNTCFVRSFPENVLGKGDSGFITIPIMDRYEKWTMVDAENMQEVLLPVIDQTVVSSVRGTSASFVSTVLDDGNGELLSCGFVYGTTPSPSVETSKMIKLTPSASISVRTGGFEILTTYYVRAYASNPKGLSYGPETVFSTTDEKDGIMGDGFKEDSDWNDGGSSGDEDDIMRGDWPGDSDWNDGGSSGDEDDIMRGDWPGDSDWNDEDVVIDENN